MVWYHTVAQDVMSSECENARSWECAPRALDDVSRATNLVAEKLPQAKPTTVVPNKDIVPKADNDLVPSKDDRHCWDKSERSTDWKACLVRIPAVVGPVQVPLASSSCYGVKAERPNQSRRSGRSLRTTGKLIATKTSNLVLRAFLAGFCSSSKQESNRSIDLIIGSPCNL